MPASIQTSHLTKCYGQTVAVRDLSLEVERGTVLGLLGPNGAGKSTTLYMLAGLVPPTSGSITLFGKDIRKGFLEIAPRMGVLVERPAFSRFYRHQEARSRSSGGALLYGVRVARSDQGCRGRAPGTCS